MSDWADERAREIVWAHGFTTHHIAAALRTERQAAELRGAERMQSAAILVARKRQRQCLSSAKKFAKEKPNDEYWATSERCAAQEANHIGDLIRALPLTPTAAEQER